MARLTVVALSAVSTFPLASSTATVTAGLMAEPTAVLLGPWTKARWSAAPGKMVKVVEVACVWEGLLEAVSV